uniref:hypothetical protein n=1 Tax=Candidatus Puniceispirillum sp. TaxID=2026719 RepID=UPI003F6A14CD
MTNSDRYSPDDYNADQIDEDIVEHQGTDKTKRVASNNLPVPEIDLLFFLSDGNLHWENGAENQDFFPHLIIPIADLKAGTHARLIINQPNPHGFETTFTYKFVDKNGLESPEYEVTFSVG